MPCESLYRFDKNLSSLPILHIAITGDQFIITAFYVDFKIKSIFYSGDNCPRINRWPVIMLPLVTTGRELQQIVTDLRLSNTLRWKEAIVLCDHNKGRSATFFFNDLHHELNVFVFVLNIIAPQLLNW